MLQLLFVLLLCVQANASNVIELTDENFELVKKEKSMFVMFYAPWCGHCKALEPKWEEAADILQKEGIKIGRYDATQEPNKVSTDEKVAGFPTLKMYHKGVGKKYEGPRQSVEDIVAYARKHAKPAATLLKTQKQIDDLIASRPDPFVIGFISKGGGKDERVFNAVSSWQRDTFDFYKVTNAKLCRQNWKDSDKSGNKKTTRKSSAFAVVRPYSSERFVWYPEEPKKNSVFDNWIWKASVAETNILTEKTMEKMRAMHQPFLVTFYDEGEDPQPLMDAMQATGLQYQGRLLTVAANLQEYGPKLYETFDIVVTPTSMVIWDVRAPNLWVAEKGDINSKSVDSFAQSFLDGTANMQVKSAKEPEQPLTDGHTELVGTSMQTAVKGDKHLFVMMYAPWCSYCKMTKPEWRQLAKLLESIDSLVIGSIDATANSLPQGWQTGGYPTIKFKRADSDEIHSFDEERLLPQLVDFLKSMLPEVTFPDVPDEPLDVPSYHDEL